MAADTALALALAAVAAAPLWVLGFHSCHDEAANEQRAEKTGERDCGSNKEFCRGADPEARKWRTGREEAYLVARRCDKVDKKYSFTSTQIHNTTERTSIKRVGDLVKGMAAHNGPFDDHRQSVGSGRWGCREALRQTDRRPAVTMYCIANPDPKMYHLM